MNKKQTILLVEDDPNLGFILQESLEMKDFTVTLAKDGEEGLSWIRNGRFDLCLLDIMLPKLDGFSLGRKIREEDTRLPIIFLTAKSLKEDRIEGFKLGCDDYITKPFSMEELILRIQAVLKRSRQPEPEETISEFHIGSYTFDSTRHLLIRDKEEKKLTNKESELLKLLCLNKNKVLHRETALTSIWGEDSFFTGRSMDVYITKLRKYFKNDTSIEIINIHGKGFKLIIN